MVNLSLKRRSLRGDVLIGLCLICGWLASGAVQAVEMKWTHFTIADPLPASAWGTGGSPLEDYDGDGDLDVVISRRETKTAYWFERKTDADWVRHVMGTAEGLAKTLGTRLSILTMTACSTWS